MTTPYSAQQPTPTRIDVRTASPYPVLISRGIETMILPMLEATEGASTFLIIHQPALAGRAAHVAKLLEAEGKVAELLEISDAEDGKTIASAELCWDRCADAGLTRQDCIISVGGGAATDLAGFIAATWMRGIRVAHVPTSLLGMVDAAVGGKTGINTTRGKNLVGAFHEPAAVLIDLDTLKDLPREELIAGSAEIIKAGFIRDERIIEIYEEDPAETLNPAGELLPELIERAIKVKAEVVAQDLKESYIREILNYGHTFCHAVEQQENYRWRHGQAVGVGMMFEAELAKAAGLIDQELVDRHRNILRSVGLATTYQHSDFDTLIEVMGRDKKNKQGKIRFVVLEGLAKPTRLESPSREHLDAAWEAISQ